MNHILGETAWASSSYAEWYTKCMQFTSGIFPLNILDYSGRQLRKISESETVVTGIYFIVRTWML